MLLAQAIRGSGPIAGVKAIGVKYCDMHRLMVRAHVLGQSSPELEARLAEVQARVLASSSGWTTQVDLELVPFAGDEVGIFADEPVLVGELAWSCSSYAARAPHIFALVAQLDGTRPLGSAPSEAWQNALLRHIRAGMCFDEYEPVTIADGELTLFEGYWGWATSHSQGWITTERFSAPCAALPSNPQRAAQFVRDVDALMTDARAELPQPPQSNQCSFCKENFPPLEFNSDLEACHGCAVTHCGIVY